jgi:hypothetical protein
MGKKSSSSGTAAAGGAFLSAGAGGGIICQEGDKSLTCKIKRTVGAVQGILFLLMVLWFIYYFIINRKNIFKK